MTDLRSTDKRKALLLGATGGIGKELATKLYENGWSLHLCSRSEQDLAALSEQLGGSAFSVVDLLSTQEIQKVFSEELDLDGTEHLAVIMCVGSILLKPVHLTTDEEWKETMDLNLNSAFFVLREGLRSCKLRNLQFLFFSSAAAKVGLVNHEAISAAKSGLEGLVRTAAATYAKRGVRVNAIAPGLVDTPLAEKLTRNEKSLEFSKAMHPLGRIGDPKEVAAFAADILNTRNSWLTGQIIGLDGGLSQLRS